MGVIFKLTDRSTYTCDQIFNALEMIDNKFKGRKELGYKVTTEEGVDEFIEIIIYYKPKDQFIVLDIKEINVDTYLDHINNDSLLKINRKNLRQVL
tara:strand:+ start:4829 stop:5116 length:288 start_codon:yes stop_codon:yes gene_type:complete